MKQSKHLLIHDPSSIGVKGRKAKSYVVKTRLFRTDRMFIPVLKAKPVSQTTCIKVGLWDLNAWVGELDKLVEGMNRSQSKFQFYVVKAMVPVGIVSQPSRVISWAKAALKRDLSPSVKQEIEQNIISNDFFPIAENIRRDLSLDFLVGISAQMIAGESEDEVYWNHFSDYEKKSIMVSSYDLRKYAAGAKRPFEAFLASIILAQMLVARHPKLVYHDDRGCLFDYNENKKSLTKNMRKLTIENECANKIGPADRDAVRSLIGFINSL